MKIDTPEPAICLAPYPDVDPVGFTLPAGACDTHAHVIAPSSAYPMVEARSYTPPPATGEDYLALLGQLGLERGVLVQPSIYGTDNRYMLSVLRQYPRQLRAVAVIDQSVADRDLHEMDAAGVRGVRFNVLFKGGVDLAQMERQAARIAELGWHMQFLIDIRDLPELQARLSALPCEVVIDHMGHMPAHLGAGHEAFGLLLRGVQERNWWVKLSGAYRLDGGDDRFAAVLPLARQLIACAPQQVLWGSDWPHVALPRMFNTGYLLDLLADWAPDAPQRQAILVDNPARLYRFDNNKP